MPRAPEMARERAASAPADAAAAPGRRRGGYAGKRAFDVACVLVTAPLWGALVAVLALLVRLRLGSPGFYRQERAGRDGRTFTLWKLRSMTDAVDRHGRPLPDADRLTPFGRWLRSTSLDELPELWCVLRGDMSLVGPRPLHVHYLERYSAYHLRRHEVRPGLTGLAQVSGRNALDWTMRLDLDVEYVERCSLRLDLAILRRTVGLVLRREGISAAGEATMREFTGYT